MKKKCLLCLLSVACILVSGFAFIACTEESKPYYGSWYVNSASSSAVVTIDKNGVTMLDTYFDDYKVDGNKLIINDTDTGYRFYENYDVLCDETIINFDTGTIPVRDGYFSADLYNFSYDGGFLIAYKFYQDGRVEYLNVNNPLRNASGTYHLKNGVLDLDMMTSLGTDADFSYNYVTKMGTLYTDVFLRGGESYFDGLEPSRNESESNDKHSSEESQAEFFQVKFDYEYEQADKEINIQKGGVVQLETPQREGYTFDGWSIDGVVKYGGDVITITHNVTAYAQWTIDTYNITYRLGEGSLENPKTSFTIHDLPYQMPFATPKEGESFVKWTTDEAGEHQITQLTELKEYTLYAHYENSANFLSYKYNETLQGYEVADFTGNGTSVTIPATYKGVAVKSIGSYAFLDGENLTSVVIPDNITSIGQGAFLGCYALTEIIIPQNVTYIGFQAFSRCSSLTEIVIPDSVTLIGGDAFSHCTSLTSIEIPDSVISISYSTFLGCSSLTSVEIPDSVTSISNSAFSNCYSLTCIEIPDSVREIYADTFDNCLALKMIIIDSSYIANVSFIGDIITYATDVYIRADITVTASIYNVLYNNLGKDTINGVEYYHYQIKGE